MSDIPEKKITFQYQGNPSNTPSVAGGTEITVYAENIDEVFQKEPNFTPIPKGPSTHFKGPNTLVVDTLKTNHKFEISGWVYNSGQKKFSLEKDKLDSNNDFQVSDTITAEELDTFVPLGDATIKNVADAEPDSLTVEGTTTGTLTEGTDYEVDYDRGRIKFLSSGSVSTDTEEDFFGNQSTFINEDFNINYTFKGSARNVGKLIQKMSQLGGTVVMRVGETDYTTSDGTTASKAYTVLPKKVKINNKAGKPDETKLELELRVSSDKRVE